MIGIFILAVTITLTVVISAAAKSKSFTYHRYKARAFLLTPTEREFFLALKLALVKKETVFSKVRQADILEVDQAVSQHFWQAFNKISQRHVDFVVCDPLTSKPLIVIELNDKSHARPDRVKRDVQLRLALSQTDIRLIEITAARSYSALEIRKIIYDQHHFPGAQKPTANSRKENPFAFASQSFLPKSDGKYIRDDKGKEQPQKTPEQKALSTDSKPFASHPASDNSDSRYMPKKTLKTHWL
jgi:hypothetical protein